jgi:hypothetical protein
MILRKKLIVIRRDLLNLDILTDDVLKKRAAQKQGQIPSYPLLRVGVAYETSDRMGHPHVRYYE